MNQLFARRLVLFAVAVAALKCVFVLSPVASPSWVVFLSGLLAGALVLHKLSVATVRPAGGTNSFLTVFLRSATIYFIPVSVLWTVLNFEFFLKYLPYIGLVLPPEWPLFSTVFGVFALGKVLLQSELSQLKRPR